MRYLWPALLTLTIVSCGDSGMQPDDDGTEHYTLLSVDGRRLPYKLAGLGDSRLEVFQGSMSLGPNGQAHRTLVLRTITLEDEGYGQGSSYARYSSEEASGTWVLQGSNVRLRLTGRDELLGVVDALGMTLSEVVRGVEVQNMNGDVEIARADYALTLRFSRR